jgi:hypothetical protein
MGHSRPLLTVGGDDGSNPGCRLVFNLLNSPRKFAYKWWSRVLDSRLPNSFRRFAYREWSTDKIADFGGRRGGNSTGIVYVNFDSYGVARHSFHHQYFFWLTDNSTTLWSVHFASGVSQQVSDDRLVCLRGLGNNARNDGVQVRSLR